MIILNDAGQLMHISIYVSEYAGFSKTQMVYTTNGSGSATTNYKITWAASTYPSTNAIDIYTAYSD